MTRFYEQLSDKEIIKFHEKALSKYKTGSIINFGFSSITGYDSRGNFSFFGRIAGIDKSARISIVGGTIHLLSSHSWFEEEPNYKDSTFESSTVSTVYSRDIFNAESFRPWSNKEYSKLIESFNSKYRSDMNDPWIQLWGFGVFREYKFNQPLIYYPYKSSTDFLWSLAGSQSLNLNLKPRTLEEILRLNLDQINVMEIDKDGEFSILN